MTGEAYIQLSITEWEIREGDKIKFTTENGTVYHLEEIARCRDGDLAALVRRFPTDDKQANVAPLSLLDSRIANPHAPYPHVWYLVAGCPVIINGIDETSGQSGLWKTSDILSIDEAVRAEG